MNTANLRQILKLRPELMAIIISLLVSLAWFLYQQPVNVDGVKYIHAANAFVHHGLNATLKIFAWPFYSILIGCIHNITGLSLLNSAYLLNALCYALLAFAFVKVLKNLKANLSIQWLGAFIIIFYPNLTHEHYMVVRDFGYYAFAFLSLSAYIRFINKGKYSQALLWNVSLIIAVLFRNEGMAFLILMPFAIFLLNDRDFKQKIIGFFKLNSINMIGFITVILLLLSHIHDKKTLAYIMHFSSHSIFDFWQLVNSNIHKLKINFLNIFGEKSARTFFIGGTISVFIVFLIYTLNFINSIFVIYGLKQKVFRVGKNNLVIILGYMAVNVVILLLFQLSQLFTTERYMMFLAMIMLLIVPYSIYDIFKRFPVSLTNKFNWQVTATISLLVYLFISASFHIGADRSYYIKAGQWVNKNTAKDSKFFVNNLRLSFYVNRPLIEKINHFPYGKSVLPYKRLAKLKQYSVHYAVIEAGERQVNTVENYIKQLKLKPLKIFSNNHHDKIFIVAINQTMPYVPH